MASTSFAEGDGAVFGAGSYVGKSPLRQVHAVYNFSVDGGAIGLITPKQTVQLPLGAVLVGGIAFSPTASGGAVTSGGSATISIGTSAGSSASSLLAATGKASFSAGAIQGLVPAWTAADMFEMTAAGYLTITVAVAALTAGIIEIFVEYFHPVNA